MNFLARPSTLSDGKKSRYCANILDTPFCIFVSSYIDIPSKYILRSYDAPRATDQACHTSSSVNRCMHIRVQRLSVRQPERRVGKCSWQILYSFNPASVLSERSFHLKSPLESAIIYLSHQYLTAAIVHAPLEKPREERRGRRC